MQLRRITNYLRWELGSLPRENFELALIDYVDTQREIQKLPPKDLHLILLSVYGYNQKEISLRLNIDPRTVNRRLNKLRSVMLRQDS